MKKPIKIFCFAVLGASLVFGFFAFLKLQQSDTTDLTHLVNISELTEDFMGQSIAGYQAIAQDYDKENIVIVISETPLENDFGAKAIVAAANNQYFLQYETEAERDAALAIINSQNGLKAFKNIIYKLSEIESDDTEKFYNSWGIAAMSLDHASQIIEDSGAANSVTAAIIDSGLNVELMNKYFPGRLSETVSVLNEGEVMTDKSGHGTHIAGTIAEGTPDNVKIMPVKTDLSTTDIIIAIDDIAYYQKADVINMSFGDFQYNEPLYLSIEGAKTKNIIAVAAAGNERFAYSAFPAAFDNTFSISAVDSSFNFANFSNSGSEITFTAPGVSIKSIMSSDAQISQGNIEAGQDDGDDDFETTDGTSMATPHVVAAVAIIKSLNKNLGFEDIGTILKEHVVDLGKEGWDELFGYGMIDFTGVSLCTTEAIDCDEHRIFTTDVASQLTVLQPVLTPFNYGSLTNLLATTMQIQTTNGATIIQRLGDFDTKDLEINGYDPYTSGSQTITVKYAELETTFSVTNPDNWELGWRYTLADNKIILTGYKPHGFNLKTLYLPSIIDGYQVAGLSGVVFQNDNNSDLEVVETIVGPVNDVEADASAFSNLKHLRTVDANIILSENATGVFAGDINLISVRLSDANTIIPNDTFRGCASLRKIDIPSSVAIIGENAFRESGVEYIQGGDRLEAIGEQAFYGSSLKDYNLPSTLKTIGDRAFARTANLEALTVSADSETYYSPVGSNAVVETGSNRLVVAIKNTIIPSTVKIIGSYAFSEIADLHELEIPEGVTTIEDYAFSPYYLQKVILPNSVTDLSPVTYDLQKEDEFHSIILWVHRDSAAEVQAEAYGLAYAVIEDEPLSEWSLTITPRSLVAFGTVTPQNLTVSADFYDYIDGNYISNKVNVTEFKRVQYGENGEFDSLRATSNGKTFRLKVYFDVGGYHNLSTYYNAFVGKATPSYEIPQNIVATFDQRLEEVELPKGFSWEEGREWAGDEIGETYVHYAKFTPEDTDNYKEVWGIEIPVLIVEEIEEPEITTLNIEVAEDILREDKLRIPSGELSKIRNRITVTEGAPGTELTFSAISPDGIETPFDSSPALATGYDIRIASNKSETVFTYKIVLLGDLNGDGLADSDDFSAMRRHLQGEAELTGVYLLAGDIKEDLKLNSADLLRLKQHLLGDKLIEEDYE